MASTPDALLPWPLKGDTRTLECDLGVERCAVTAVRVRSRIGWGLGWSRDAGQSAKDLGLCTPGCLMAGHTRFIALFALPLGLSCNHALDQNNAAQTGFMCP